MDTNTTQPAEQIPLPSSPVDSFESVLSRQLKARPEIARTDLKSLEQLSENDVFDSGDMDEVPDLDVQSLLDQNNDQSETTDKKESKKKQDTIEENSFDLSDLDLTSDDVKVEDKPEDKPKKKTKEDSVAELRKRAESYEAEAKEKEAKLAEYQSKLEQLEQTLEKTAFEKSPKFKEKFLAPFEGSVQTALEFAKEYAGDESIAERALSLKGKERIDFIDDSFGGAAAAQFLSLINDADTKRVNLQGAIDNYRATSAELAGEEQSQQQSQIEGINKHFDRVYNHLSQKTEFFRKGDDEDHNKEVERRVDAAKSLVMGTANQNDQLSAPFLAVIAKEVVSENEKLRAELAKYKNRAAKDASVQPRITRSASDRDADISGKPQSALDSVRSQLRGL